MLLPISPTSAFAPPRSAAGVAEIAASLAGRLQIPSQIKVTISEKNERGVSVEPLAGGEKSFLLTFDRVFLESLTDDEVIAAVAHELGHVWIFSHHPYLQTETLANEIALRVVDRRTLTQVYTKLWARLGIAGNVEDLLGPDPTASVPAN